MKHTAQNVILCDMEVLYPATYAHLTARVEAGVLRLQR